MSLRDTIRRLMPGITDEHAERVVDEIDDAWWTDTECRHTAWAATEAQEPDPVGVEPATDEQIAQIERAVLSGIAPGERSDALALIARFRQEQADAAQVEDERDDALQERGEAEARAERAERERDEAEERAEKVTAAERAVLDAAEAWAHCMHDYTPGCHMRERLATNRVSDAVRALRDAHEAGDE